MKNKGLFFTGIDVIGNYLTEINVTSPTGMQEINKLNSIKLEKIFWDKLEKKLLNSLEATFAASIHIILFYFDLS